MTFLAAVCIAATAGYWLCVRTLGCGAVRQVGQNAAERRQRRCGADDNEDGEYRRRRSVADHLAASVGIAGLKRQQGQPEQHDGGSPNPLLVNVGLTAVRDHEGKAQLIIVTVEDITERTHSEIELRHSQKLESVLCLRDTPIADRFFHSDILPDLFLACMITV